jgi:hypothetical protein
MVTELNTVRCEADLYGYSLWLAEYLDLNVCPRSLRGFQHGWIWWDIVDGELAGFDPNLSEYFGILVQDKQIEQSLLRDGIYAKACGLPFLNFLKHTKIETKRNKGKLYIPTHSNPWNDVSKSIKFLASNFANKDYSIMLSWNDRHIDIDGFNHIEIGAGALETTSFYRMATIFSSYDEVITDSIGSHVLYAIACGAKVGIDANAYDNARKMNIWAGTADEELSKKRPTKQDYYDINYIDKKYSGLVIDDNSPSYCQMPEIAYERPEVIADLLGWGITLDCEMAKYASNRNSNS